MNAAVRLMSRSFRAAAPACLAALLCLAALPRAAVAQGLNYRDYFNLKDAQGNRGEGKSGVEFTGQAIEGGKHVFKYMDRSLEGVGQSVESWKLYSVDFGSSPEFRSAMKDFNDGKYAKAAGGFSDLAGKADLWWLPSHALYYQAESQRYQGASTDAIDTFEKLLSAQPESRFTAEALYRVAILKAEAGDLPGAEMAVQKLTATGETYGPGWKAKGNLLIADIHFQQKKYSDALPAYEAIARDLESSYAENAEKAGLYSSAMVRVGICLIESGQIDRASQQYERMVTAENEAVKAAGFLGRGQIKLKKGEHREGALDFLRVLYLYPDQSTLKVDAAYGAGRCYAQLYKAESKESDRDKTMKMVYTLKASDREDLAKEVYKLVN